MGDKWELLVLGESGLVDHRDFVLLHRGAIMSMIEQLLGQS